MFFLLARVMPHTRQRITKGKRKRPPSVPAYLPPPDRRSFRRGSSLLLFFLAVLFGSLVALANGRKNERHSDYSDGHLDPGGHYGVPHLHSLRPGIFLDVLGKCGCSLSSLPAAFFLPFLGGESSLALSTSTFALVARMNHTLPLSLHRGRLPIGPSPCDAANRVLSCLPCCPTVLDLHLPLLRVPHGPAIQRGSVVRLRPQPRELEEKDGSTELR